MTQAARRCPTRRGFVRRGRRRGGHGERGRDYMKVITAYTLSVKQARMVSGSQKVSDRFLALLMPYFEP
jgi:hypothetical protein